MSNFHRWAGKPWSYGAIFAALAGVGALIAREQGWLDSVPLLNRTSAPRSSQATNDLVDQAAGPFETDEFDAAPGRISQSEPADLAREPDLEDEGSARQRRAISDRQIPTEPRISLSLDDSTDDVTADDNQ